MFSTAKYSCVLCFVVTLTAMASTLVAHPFHVCVGQMQWNATNKSWEVSIRLDPRDLESAMSVDFFWSPSDQKVSVTDDNFAELATRYLSQYFSIRRTPIATTAAELESLLKEKAAVPKPAESTDQSVISWVGMEPEQGWLWLHFEMSQPEVDESRHKLWLVHQLLLDTVANQENSILIDPRKSQRFSLQFRWGAAVREFKKPTNPEKPFSTPTLGSKP
jgi:hypothetical protein